MINKSLQNIDITRFQRNLVNWYKINQRDLPWRMNQDPYRVWVSEIMLQQTKVDTVIPYFHRFMEKFPTLEDLAAADEQEVLKAWEGLGYYSRARNLQNAVREVVAEYGGEVPSDPKDLGALKGVGPYTKGAILSIAFNQAEPAVDGNVMRVFSRVLRIEEDITLQRTKKLFEIYVKEMIDKDDPSSFNQAVMELGALICTPKAPACLFCPVQEQCSAFAEGIQEELPIKKKAKKQKTLPYIVPLIKNTSDQYLIEKRPDQGLLANLWQFPMVPKEEMDNLGNWFYNEYGISIELDRKVGNLKHVFSHIIWELDIYEASTTVERLLGNDIRFVSKEEMSAYPFPVSHQKMMDYL
ncbi:A/G-specific adenine glycosylase [Virgibacillus halodenitrificans]|uniref:A/G-specific adenine glycosylase n=1 Tax=Virgibacillus halodenitrificans TaxID=1482 RepID=UPI00045C4B87|nr:A/G-specific adenine glycosylase [Virgibacillus halodenitrificans]MCG1028083.1 A/G-specific adenine glycosylase [Virgibacillus halodenitrificans]WHX24945.1 A/G-specific adenine glycosylase [Virgibacillus halodenitrificans]CDQ36694.1 putative A/G-specific adenine glycosylase YfhQ [Virgibacillus halodenitrificans]